MDTAGVHIHAVGHAALTLETLRILDTNRDVILLYARAIPIVLYAFRNDKMITRWRSVKQSLLAHLLHLARTQGVPTQRCQHAEGDGQHPGRSIS